MNIIPILLYHGITSDPHPDSAPFAVSPENFADHMEAVKASGRRCLTISELLDDIADLKEPCVAITFDDGYLDFLTEALPAMTTHDLKSTLYVTSGFMNGRPSDLPCSHPADPMLSWAQLPDLVAEGTEIGAHSHTHPQLDTLSAPAAWEELVRSKALIEDAIDMAVRSFAYPHGYNSPQLRRQVNNAGYDSAVGVRNMFSHTGDDRFNIARLTVTADTTTESIQEWLDASGADIAKSEKLVTRGWRAYRRSKAIATGKSGTVYR